MDSILRQRQAMRGWNLRDLHRILDELFLCNGSG